MSDQSEPVSGNPAPADVIAHAEVAGVKVAASEPEKISIVPEASLPADQVPTVGHLTSTVQDREIPHFIISEVELGMLEAIPDGFERTWLGAAIGGVITFGLADETLSRLTAYHHALVVMGFWVSLFACVYFTFRVVRARSATQKIVAGVRQRPKDDSIEVETPSSNRLRFRKPWERR